MRLTERLLNHCETFIANSSAPQFFRIALLSVFLPTSLFSSAAADQQAASAPAPQLEFSVQTGHTAEIQGLEYASSGKFFASAGKDSTIKLWSPSGTLIRTVHTGFWVNYFALSHDCKFFLAATRLGNTFLLSVDGHLIHRFPDIPIRDGYVSAVAISEDDRYIAIGTTRGLVLYRLDGTVETRLQPDGGDNSEVNSVLYTPDGRIVSGHADGKLRFWTAEGKLLHTVPAHEYAILTLALSPDGKTLATAGSPYYFALIPKNVKPVTKLWDLEGNQLAEFPSQLTQSLRFSADGEKLVTGGRLDGQVESTANPVNFCAR